MEIIRTRTFERSLKKLGASDGELAALEEAIASDPTSGDVIPGLGGARKIRFGMAGKGKSGGRAIYIVMVVRDVAYLLLAYSKSTKTDLSQADKDALKAIIKELKDG
jgi:hypothetical protein